MAIPIQIRLISKHEVEKLLSVKDTIEAVERVFYQLGMGRIYHPVHAPMWMDADHNNMFLASPAYNMESGDAGVKWVNLFSKHAPELPASYGNLLILSHSDNAQPYAIIEATPVTTMRTAGGHGAVAAKYLAKKESESLAVIGCGEQAKAGIQALLYLFPSLRDIKLFDISQASMNAVSRLFSEKANIQCCSDAQSAVENADIVFMLTTAQKPIVQFEWLKKGAFVSGLYSFNDLDPESSRKADKWYLGSREVDGHNIIDFPAMQKYSLSHKDVFGDMGEVLTGKCLGRENDNEIIVYTHMGMAALDLALGKIIYQRAVENNCGLVYDFS